MLNAHFSSIEKYRDVESLNYYELLLKKGKTKEEALEILGARSRDNSRTPMRWNGERYGGFSAAEPWLSMGAGFRKEITVEAQEKDRDSILAFYKKLIAVRKQCPVIAEGDIRFLETGTDMVLGYKRALGAQEILVFCNLGREKQRIKIEEEWKDYNITFPKCRYTNNGLRFYIPVTLIKLQGYSWFPHGNPLKISGFFLAWMHQYTSAAPSS